MGIPVDALGNPFLQCLDNNRSSLKIHVRHPHRQHLWIRRIVPFARTCAATVIYHVKIVLHNIFHKNSGQIY